MFKPTELFTPLKYKHNACQSVNHATPVSVATDMLFLECVSHVDFNYDSGIDNASEVTIDYCEIVVTFEEGNQMFIKTTSNHILDAFGFDWQVAYKDAPEEDKPDAYWNNQSTGRP